MTVAEGVIAFFKANPFYIKFLPMTESPWQVLNIIMQASCGKQTVASELEMLLDIGIAEKLSSPGGKIKNAMKYHLYKDVLRYKFRFIDKKNKDYMRRIGGTKKEFQIPVAIPHGFNERDFLLLITDEQIPPASRKATNKKIYWPPQPMTVIMCEGFTRIFNGGLTRIDMSVNDIIAETQTLNDFLELFGVKDIENINRSQMACMITTWINFALPVNNLLNIVKEYDECWAKFLSNILWPYHKEEPPLLVPMQPLIHHQALLPKILTEDKIHDDLSALTGEIKKESGFIHL